MNNHLSASILCADPLELGNTVRQLDKLGLPWLHPGQSPYRTQGWDGRPDPDLWAAGID